MFPHYILLQSNLFHTWNVVFLGGFATNWLNVKFLALITWLTRLQFDMNWHCTLLFTVYALKLLSSSILSDGIDNYQTLPKNTVQKSTIVCKLRLFLSQYDDSWPQILTAAYKLTRNADLCCWIWRMKAGAGALYLGNICSKSCAFAQNNAVFHLLKRPRFLWWRL